MRLCLIISDSFFFGCDFKNTPIAWLVRSDTIPAQLHVGRETFLQQKNVVNQLMF